MLLVDTDVIIDIRRGFPPAVAWFEDLHELPRIPGFVLMELVQEARNAVELQRVMRLVAPLQTVWPSSQDCDRALTDLRIHHLSNGLGVIDALIASCALGLPATLCTFNVKHYRGIQDLLLLQPYAKS